MNRNENVAPSPFAGSSFFMTLLPGLARAGLVAIISDRLAVWEAAAAQGFFGHPFAIAAPVIARVVGIVFHGFT